MRAALQHVDVSEQPFRERAPIVLDLPVPRSVNNSRRINLAGLPGKTAWVKAADSLVMAKGKLPTAIIGPWSMVVTMNEAMWRLDPDNGLKDIIDYCRRLELIENDSPRFAREIILRWGDAPEGCRVTISPAEPPNNPVDPYLGVKLKRSA